MSKITKETNIIEMIKKYPETAQALFDLGIHCVGCHAASFETLEQGFKGHGLTDEQIEKAVKELNKTAEKSGNKTEEKKEEE